MACCAKRTLGNKRHGKAGLVRTVGGAPERLLTTMRQRYNCLGRRTELAGIAETVQLHGKVQFYRIVHFYSQEYILLIPS